MSMTRIVVVMLWVGLMVPGVGRVSSQTPSTGSGQAYPYKPIRILASPAGTGGDFAARLIAGGISGPLDQPVIVEKAKTPATVIRRLNQEIVRALNQADVKEKFVNVGADVIGSSPEQAAAAIKSDVARLGKLIKDAGIKAD